ncbi:MAG: hypothetical protein QOD06_2105 [Candidatus Binatota bacterium]|jgi:uncharacterized protein (DUF1330 family)|nr:hypothetical protein [Candidatus Binatota bacterium]
MSVVVIVQGNLRAGKEDALDRYRKVAQPVIAKHGGQVIARGSGVGRLHGSRTWKVGIVVRFPDAASAAAWHDDPEYQQVLPLRGEAYEDIEINTFQE